MGVPYTNIFSVTVWPIQHADDAVAVPRIVLTVRLP